MCIMFITDKIKGLPDNDTLEHIFTSNPDGGGLAYVYTDKDGQRFIGMEKGLMTKELFVSKVAEHFAKLNTDKDYFIAHTRISTSGGKTPNKTHPFKTKNDGFIFQNGVTSSVEHFLRDNESDTEWLAKNYEGMAWVNKYDKSSRFVVINPDGSLEMSDNWVKDDSGRLWSHSGYKPYKSYGAYGGYGYTKGRSNYWDDDGYGYSPYARPTMASSSDDYVKYIKPLAQDLVMAMDMLYDGQGTKLYDYLSGKRISTYNGSLKINGREVKGLKYDEKDGFTTIYLDDEVKVVGPDELITLSNEINFLLRNDSIRFELFYDKDLGSDLDIRVQVNRVSYATYKLANADRVNMDYTIIFKDKDGYVSSSKTITSRLTLSAPESDIIRLAKETIFSEVTELTLDDVYWESLGDYANVFDTSHRMTIRK